MKFLSDWDMTTDQVSLISGGKFSELLLSVVSFRNTVNVGVTSQLIRHCRGSD